MPHTRITHADMVLGQLIVFKRKQLGLEQGELAAKMGVSRAALSRLERGESSLNLSILQLLARGLETKMSKLIAELERAMADLDAQGVDIVDKKETEKKNMALALVGAAALALLLAR